MEVSSSSSPGEHTRTGVGVSVEHVRGLLDTLDRGVVLTDRDGQVLTLNDRACKCLGLLGFDGQGPLNILRALLQVDGQDILQRIGNGNEEIALDGNFAGKPYQVRLRWIRESDWLAIELEAPEMSL